MVGFFVASCKVYRVKFCEGSALKMLFLPEPGGVVAGQLQKVQVQEFRFQAYRE